MPQMPSSALPIARTWTPGPEDPLTQGVCSDCTKLIEADHRIANHLAMLRSYLHLQQAELDRRQTEVTPESVRLILASVDAQVVAVSQLHRALAVGGLRASADISEQLRITCAPFRSGFSGVATITEDFERGCFVEPDQVLPLMQIVAEAVTNALKHGPGPTGRATVGVSCRKEGRGGLLIEVADDGKGFPPGFDPMSDGGLGFRLLRGLSKQLGALIAFKTGPGGVTFQLALAAPLSTNEPA